MTSTPHIVGYQVAGTVREVGADPARTRAPIGELIARVASGELQVVIDRTSPLAEAADAHRHIESRQAFGRVLLVP